MKRLLMLGGSYYQVPAIKAAKEMGHYVIICDYLKDNLGRNYADEYYDISTTDKKAVLALGKSLGIDGIISYASDAAAPIAAYVAEQLGLPTNPYQSVEILSNKDRFRALLKQHHFNVPRAKGYQSLEDALAEFHHFKMPVMVKPVDSSGSRGVSKIDSIECLQEAVECALSFSKVQQRFIIEEFIEKDGYMITGDGFSVNGRLIFRCFANAHFESTTLNPFIPTGMSWPSNISNHMQNKIHNEIQRLLTVLNMKTGPVSFDIFIDKEKNIYLIELGPRNSGYLVPQVIEYATGIDMVKYAIQAALGEECSELVMVTPTSYWSCYMLNSNRSGLLEDVKIDAEFKKNNIVQFELLVKPGEIIPAFTGANLGLGIMILKFNSQQEILEKMDCMNEYVKVIIEEFPSCKNISSNS